MATGGRTRRLNGEPKAGETTFERRTGEDFLMVSGRVAISNGERKCAMRFSMCVARAWPPRQPRILRFVFLPFDILIRLVVKFTTESSLPWGHSCYPLIINLGISENPTTQSGVLKGAKGFLRRPPERQR